MVQANPGLFNYCCSKKNTWDHLKRNHQKAMKMHKIRFQDGQANSFQTQTAWKNQLRLQGDRKSYDDPFMKQVIWSERKPTLP